MAGDLAYALISMSFILGLIFGVWSQTWHERPKRVGPCRRYGKHEWSAWRTGRRTVGMSVQNFQQRTCQNAHCGYTEQEDLRCGNPRWDD